jgi:peptide/nickel transport system ATP-binding protein
MADKTNILAVKDLNISFPGAVTFTAVNNISFELEKGSTLAIVGESGSGKSLTALALMGLLPSTASLEGTIDLNSESNSYTLASLTDNNSWQAIRGQEIGMVFQEPMSSLNPVMKIGKQLTESIITHQDVSKERAKEIAIDWLRKVKLPNPDRIYKRYPHQLSGGQKQRVMIAMAMCNHPVLLIADEPTTALDVTVQMEVIQLMQDLQQQTGTAMIFITHDLALAATIADKVLVMYKGEAVEYGDTKQVLKNPVHPYTQALVACKPSPEHKNKRLPIVSDFLEADKSKATVLLQDQPQYQSTIVDTPLLAVNKVKVWFTEHKNWLGQPTNYFKAVDDVSFSLRKGEILGLVGESGCGKSTLSRSLIGLIPVKEGEIIFNNKDLAHLSDKEWVEVRRQIQMIFQDPFASLNPRMTVGDMLMEPLRFHSIVPNREVKKEAQRLLDLVHLPSNAFKRYSHQFSGGQRQRLGIARALALRPQLLICDESVSALDVSVQAQILNLLKELQAEFQLSYLFISHDLSVVHYISDRVMVMQAGKIVEQGEAAQVLKHPENEYTRKLIAAMPEIK